MTRREDAHIKMQTVLDDIPINDFTVGDIHSVVAKIYESIGTCQTCKKQATRDCHMVFFNPETYKTVDHSRCDGFCSEFERKQND